MEDKKQEVSTAAQETKQEQQPQAGTEQSSSKPVDTSKSTFAAPTAMPVFTAIPGVYYDFNYGTRVAVAQDAPKDYRVVIVDANTEAILYNNIIKRGSSIHTNKTYYVPTRILIYDPEDQARPSKPVFDHVMSISGLPVLVQFAGIAIGDNIGWFSYIERFHKKYGPKLTVSMSPAIADLVRDQYPDITIITPEQAKQAIAGMYATYRVGLFFGGNTNAQPFDFRYVGLHKTAGHILGLTTPEELADCPPRIDLSAPRPIKDKYVVIAVQASSKAKLWNNPAGWRSVIKHLKDKGYRVLCIDKDPEVTVGYTTNSIPNGCEDFTGNLPLKERVALIQHADAFIGLSSGLAWLAWCCKVPVVLISGFTDPYNEFYTPYRVHNSTVCHGCWHGLQDEFSHTDYFWCPRKTENTQKFECTRFITAAQVAAQVDKALAAKRTGRKRSK